MENKINTIVFFISSLGGGGAEKVLTILSQEAILNGFKVVVVTTFHKDVYEPFKLCKEVKVIRYSKYKKNILNKFLFLHNTIRSNSGAVFISFLTNVNILILIVRIFRKFKLIVSERSDMVQADLPIYFRILRYVLYPFADRLVVQNKKNYLYSKRYKLNSRIVIIPNPISNKKILRWSRKSGNNLKIVMIGRIDKIKNYRFAIDILHKLPDTFDLYIYGDGIEKSNLINYINEKSLSERVHFKGFVADVIAEIVNFDIFFHASIYEGFPNVILEAAVTGIPVITSNCGDSIIEIAHLTKNVFIYNVGDENGAIELISRIAMNSDEEICENNLLLEKYDSNKIFQKWVREFD